MIGVLLGDLWPYLLAAGGVVAAFIGTYLRGRKDATDKAEKRAAITYIETTKDVRDEDYLDPDINDARDRLREFGRKH